MSSILQLRTTEARGRAPAASSRARTASARARPHVLVSAYACNPYQGSEEGVGFGWVRAIARDHRVTVLTAEFHMADLARWREDHPDVLPDDLRFVAVAPRRWHYRPTPVWEAVHDSPLKPLLNLAYTAWLRDAARVAWRILAEDPFALVHLVTYVGYRFPGTYWRLPVPFVWGPLGGLENAPWPFLRAMGVAGGTYHAVRNVINAVQRRVLPGPRHALRRAGPHGVLAATRGIERHLLRWYGAPSRVVSEIGMAPGEIVAPRPRVPGEPLRLVWSGKHLPGKGLGLLLDALARLSSATLWELAVLGTGERTAAWKARARRLGLAERVRWTGWLARSEAVGVMRDAHVLVLTSMKDLTSTVLLEGAAQGLAVIAPDHCGFPDVLAPDAGILVPVRRPGQFVRDLAQSLGRLAADEPLRLALATRAGKRARGFSWEAKADAVRETYGQVLTRARGPGGA